MDWKANCDSGPNVQEGLTFLRGEFDEPGKLGIVLAGRNRIDENGTNTQERNQKWPYTNPQCMIPLPFPVCSLYRLSARPNEQT